MTMQSLLDYILPFREAIRVITDPILSNKLPFLGYMRAVGHLGLLSRDQLRSESVNYENYCLMHAYPHTISKIWSGRNYPHSSSPIASYLYPVGILGR